MAMPAAQTKLEMSIIRIGVRISHLSTTVYKSDHGNVKSAAMPVTESDRLIVLCRYRDLHEALMAQGTLDSADIQCFLTDDNMVRMNWMWSNAIGGVRLFVWERDASEAADLLDQPILERLYVPGVGEHQQPACPHCGSLEVSFHQLNRRIVYPAAFIIGIPLLLYKRGWNCESCGFRWRAPS